MPFHLVFPFFSSLLFVVGVLLVKRAAALQLGVWRITFVCNFVAAFVFLALLPMGGTVNWHEWYRPALVALLFVIGQVLSFLALDGGDVSVVTPTMGTKTVMVAWFSSLLLQVTLPWQLWCSAILSSLAVLALSRNSGAPPKGNVSIGRTITLALLATLSYALFDVLVQKWSPAWGAGTFLPIMFGFCALFSLAFIPLFKKQPLAGQGTEPQVEQEPLTSAPIAVSELTTSPDADPKPLSAWPWLIAGAFCMGVQALSLITALAVYADATAINVVYSARGLWSVMAVWLVGHWFHNQEKHLDRRTLIWRLIGAGLMTLAIVITLTR